MSEKTKIKVGFQGIRGAYSEEAAIQYFGQELTEIRGYASFPAVYAALQSGEISDAILPFENSVAGPIEENFQCLQSSGLQVLGETILRVRHCLLIHKDQNPNEIRIVISHPQALSQCQQAIEQWQAEPFFDTAGAAQHIASQSPMGKAAIASETAAKLYGLKVFRNDIADGTINYTRFFHLGQAKACPINLKGIPTVLVAFTERQQHAAIGKLLQTCINQGLSLQSLWARPARKANWTYVYFAELRSSLQAALNAENTSLPEDLLKQVKASQELEILGYYLSNR